LGLLEKNVCEVDLNLIDWATSRYWIQLLFKLLFLVTVAPERASVVLLLFLLLQAARSKNKRINVDAFFIINVFYLLNMMRIYKAVAY